MAQADLVSLADAKAWLGITTADTLRDATLSRLITQMSRSIYTSLNRQFLLPKIITETYDGNGQTRLQLRNWPAISVSSLTVDGLAITVSPDVSTSGYFLEPSDTEPPGNMQLITLRGKRFSKGESNVQVSYLCGYLVSGEISVIPATPFQITAQAPYGIWGSDYLVQFTGGATLTAVASAPAAGQYFVSNGVYTFAAADVGKSVTLSYGYIPADLTQVTLEWLAYRWAAKDRVGQTSKSIGGQETVSYTNEAVPAFVAQSLSNFRRIVPC